MGNYFAKEETSSTQEKVGGRTKMDKLQTYEYTWTIDLFPVWVEFAKKYESSPVFTTGEYKWCLEIKPKNEHEGHDYVGLFLTPIASPKTKVYAGFKAGFLNNEGKWVGRQKLYSSFNFKEKSGWGWNRFVRKDLILDKDNHLLSANDTLTIFCEITIFSDPSHVAGSSHLRPQLTLPECHLTSSFQSFLQSGNLSDVTVVVGRKEFLAHKLILSAASPVFAAMFEHDMKEKQENRVKIEGVDLPVFEDFLQFIYTGKVNKLERNAEALLAVAERYGVERLKALCEESLAGQLTVGNAAHLYATANLYNANQLKAFTLEFLRKRDCEIDIESQA